MYIDIHRERERVSKRERNVHPAVPQDQHVHLHPQRFDFGRGVLDTLEPQRCDFRRGVSDTLNASPELSRPSARQHNHLPRAPRAYPHP